MTFTAKFNVGDLVLKECNGKVPYVVEQVPNYSHGYYLDQ
jgi:hypothetical protein